MTTNVVTGLIPAAVRKKASNPAVRLTSSMLEKKLKRDAKLPQKAKRNKTRSRGST